jgi:hypothetical protein
MGCWLQREAVGAAGAAGQQRPPAQPQPATEAAARECEVEPVQAALHRIEGRETAPVPAVVIDKGLPKAGLLAQVIVAKHGDHLPLYRQEAI